MILAANDSVRAAAERNRPTTTNFKRQSIVEANKRPRGRKEGGMEGRRRGSGGRERQAAGASNGKQKTKRRFTVIQKDPNKLAE